MRGGYRDKERDRKSRDNRYDSRRNYGSNKHSRANSRNRWPQESYPASSSGHHKRHEGRFLSMRNYSDLKYL
jgi:hypothetical protein